MFGICNHEQIILEFSIRPSNNIIPLFPTPLFLHSWRVTDGAEQTKNTMRLLGCSVQLAHEHRHHHRRWLDDSHERGDDSDECLKLSTQLHLHLSPPLVGVKRKSLYSGRALTAPIF